METRLHLLESFMARGSDGGTYKVCGYERLARDESVGDGEEHWEPTGVAEYRLQDGRHVEAYRDGSLHVAGTGIALAPMAQAPASAAH
jgi:hypothetical protein